MPAIHQSDLDKRKYRVVTLSNSLKAILIQDDTTDMASASVNVNVGHFSDPDDLPGLAHFCEHMLFLGTEKYPVENEYSTYLSKHGGSSNAYTSMQDTNYHFAVTHAHLYGALDRFAQFFISPLFTDSCTDREVQAVNSENLRNLQNDFWRLYQLQKSVGSSPNHPFSKFGTGNADTLSVHPKTRGVDVRDELLKFHQKHYSANVMGLAVIGRESLDQLEAWVTELFTAIPNKKIAPPTFEGHPLIKDKQLKRIYAVPIKDNHSLHVAWPLPDMGPEYRIMPERYISHLVGHEGPGSILSELKKLGYATSLSAGCSHGGSHVGFSLFEVQVDLTPEGVDNHETVLDIVLAYVRILHETPVQEWIFKESQQLGAIDFRFKEKTMPIRVTTSLSSKLLTVAEEDLLRHNLVFIDYKPDLIRQTIDQIRTDNLQVYLTSRKFSERVDLVHEQWYQTSYAVESMVAKTFEQVGKFDGLKLPERNIFIPTEFELISRQLPNESPSAAVSTQPTVVYQSPCSKLLYKLDDSFNVPKANVLILARTPLGRATAWAAVQLSLFTELFNDALNEFSYYAEIAHLKYKINEEPEGLQIDVHGYHDKLSLLTTKIAERLAALAPKPDRFRIIKEMLLRELSNQLYDMPQTQVALDMNEIMQESFHTTSARLEALHDTTFEQFSSFVALALRNMHLDFLVHGNITQEAAIGLVQSFEQVLKCKPIAADDNRAPRSLKPERGVCVSSERLLHDVNEKNSAVEVYFDVCRDEQVHTRNLLSLLSLMFREPLFDQLRTKEQLGYVVASTTRNHFSSRGLSIYIQSGKPPAVLWNHILKFLDHFKTTILEPMTEEDFARYKQSLIARKQEKDKTLYQLTKRFWNEVLNGYYEFDRVETDVATIEQLTHAQLLALYEHYIFNPKTAAVVITARVSHAVVNEPETKTWAAGTRIIADVNDLRSSLEMYPVVRPAGHPVRQVLRDL